MNQGPFPNAPAAGFGQVQATAKDESDLNTLSILHYVWSALLGCTTVGMIAYFVLLGGIVGMSVSESGGDPTGAAAAAGFTIVIAIVLGVVLTALFIIHLLAASGLRKRKRRVLTFIASGLMCTSFPLGTALGVWTFMVLGRPGVKALYGGV